METKHNKIKDVRATTKEKRNRIGDHELTISLNNAYKYYKYQNKSGETFRQLMDERVGNQSCFRLSLLANSQFNITIFQSTKNLITTSPRLLILFYLQK